MVQERATDEDGLDIYNKLLKISHSTIFQLATLIPSAQTRTCVACLQATARVRGGVTFHPHVVGGGGRFIDGGYYFTPNYQN